MRPNKLPTRLAEANGSHVMGLAGIGRANDNSYELGEWDEHRPLYNFNCSKML